MQVPIYKKGKHGVDMLLCTISIQPEKLTLRNPVDQISKLLQRGRKKSDKNGYQEDTLKATLLTTLSADPDPLIVLTVPSHI